MPAPLCRHGWICLLPLVLFSIYGIMDSTFVSKNLQATHSLLTRSSLQRGSRTSDLGVRHVLARQTPKSTRSKHQVPRKQQRHRRNLMYSKLTGTKATLEDIPEPSWEIFIYLTGDNMRGVSVVDDMKHKGDPLNYEEIRWETKLAIKLLRELQKGDKSNWAPYIRILPKSVDLPMFWEQNDLDELELDAMKDMVTDYKYQLDQAWYEVEQRYPDFTRELFDWAWSIVLSRSFSFETNSGERHALIPIADMFNHGSDTPLEFSNESEPNYRANILYPPSNVVWKVRKDKMGRIGMEMRMSEDLPKEQEALISYGGSDKVTFIANNDLLLLNYGFVSGGNSLDDINAFENIEHLIRWYIDARSIDPTGKPSANDVERDFFKMPSANKFNIMHGGNLDTRAVLAVLNMERLRAGLTISNEVDSSEATSFARRTIVMRLVQLMYDEFPSGLKRDLLLLSGDLREPETWEPALMKPDIDSRETMDKIHYAQLAIGYSRALQALTEMGVIASSSGHISDVDTASVPTSLKYGSRLWRAVQYRAHKKMMLVDAILHFGDSLENTDAYQEFKNKES
ncbi:hypothetical protein AAMO2058_001703100 [Amorphochlora amoebiformis]